MKEREKANQIFFSFLLDKKNYKLKFFSDQVNLFSHEFFCKSGQGGSIMAVQTV